MQWKAALLAPFFLYMIMRSIWRAIVHIGMAVRSHSESCSAESRVAVASSACGTWWIGGWTVTRGARSQACVSAGCESVLLLGQSVIVQLSVAGCCDVDVVVSVVRRGHNADVMLSVSLLCFASLVERELGSVVQRCADLQRSAPP
jgi:hypothetical protein